MRLLACLACLAWCCLCAPACTEKHYAPFPVPDPSFQKGITFLAWGREILAGEAAHRELTDLAATGANWVAIIPSAFQADLYAPEITFDNPLAPSESSARQAIRWARELGLHVMVKPSVDLVDQNFRGWIVPPDLGHWFAVYQSWVVSLARLATEEGAEQFSVGCELVNLAGETDRWAALIAEVRKVFSGKLTYAANWDEIDKVTFWPFLDVPGVDAYYPLTELDDPSVADLMAGWRQYLPALKNLADNYGGRLLVAELGIPSRAGVAAKPFDWMTAGDVDLDLQARYYEAALRVLMPLDYVEGMFFWGWYADPGPDWPGNTNVSVNGKPAVEVMTAAWSPQPAVPQN